MSTEPDSWEGDTAVYLCEIEAVITDGVGLDGEGMNR